MRKLFLFLVLCFPLLANPAGAKSYIDSAGVKNPRAISDVPFTWLGLKLYDASLYTPSGAAFSWQNPMAIELTYARKLPRAKLVNATRDELKRLEGSRADHPAILADLNRCLRDVTRGDRFTAVARNAASVALFFNGTKTCKLTQASIGKRFLNIWLSENSRSSAASRKLKGL